MHDPSARVETLRGRSSSAWCSSTGSSRAGPLLTARELARFTRVLVPDLPGVGPHRQSGVPAFADHADAVAEAIADWVPSQVTVVGHSLGAEVVVELARRHPSLVQRAVLIGPTGDPAAGSAFGVWKRWMATAVSEPLAFNLLAVAELARMGPLRMARLLRRSFQDPVEGKLPELRCPTLHSGSGSASTHI